MKCHISGSDCVLFGSWSYTSKKKSRLLIFLMRKMIGSEVISPNDAENFLSFYLFTIPWELEHQFSDPKLYVLRYHNDLFLKSIHLRVVIVSQKSFSAELRSLIDLSLSFKFDVLFMMLGKFRVAVQFSHVCNYPSAKLNVCTYLYIYVIWLMIIGLSQCHVSYIKLGQYRI